MEHCYHCLRGPLADALVLQNGKTKMYYLFIYLSFHQLHLHQIEIHNFNAKRQSQHMSRYRQLTLPRMQWQTKRDVGDKRGKENMTLNTLNVDS